MSKKYQVPYRDGNLMSRDPSYWGYKNVEWRENVLFPAALKLSKLPFDAKDTACEWTDVATGAKYPMFFTQLTEMIMEGAVISNGTVRGVWDIRKIGNSFGVRLQEAEKPQEETPFTYTAPMAQPGGHVVPMTFTYSTVIEDEGFCRGCYTAGCRGCKNRVVKNHMLDGGK